MNLVDARILVVDDEPMLLEILGKWLRAVSGGEVFTATHGAAALALMQSEQIDLLLTDIRMPVMDGITLVRRLAEIGHTLPSIVFMSGFGDVNRREMYGLGVEAFVTKPFDQDELLQILKNAVAERSTLWRTEMAIVPRQSLIIEARRMGRTAGPETIGLGRGGISICSPEQIVLGKLGFKLVMTNSAMQITGQGYVRWFSRNDNKAGIELAFLNPDARQWLTEAIAFESPRSFIPGS